MLHCLILHFLMFCCIKVALCDVALFDIALLRYYTIWYCTIQCWMYLSSVLHCLLLHCVDVALHYVPLFSHCTTIWCCTLFKLHYIMFHYFNVVLCDVAPFWHWPIWCWTTKFHFLLLHCIKVALGRPYLMSNVPLFHIVLVAVEIVPVALFSVVLF